MVRVVGWWAMEEQAGDRIEPAQVVRASTEEGMGLGSSLFTGRLLRLARRKPGSSMKLPPNVKIL